MIPTPVTGILSILQFVGQEAQHPRGIRLRQVDVIEVVSSGCKLVGMSIIGCP
jgi:hypothetical protein